MTKISKLVLPNGEISNLENGKSEKQLETYMRTEKEAMYLVQYKMALIEALLDKLTENNSEFDKIIKRFQKLRKHRELETKINQWITLLERVKTIGSVPKLQAILNCK